jgi:HSP20 family protein
MLVRFDFPRMFDDLLEDVSLSDFMPVTGRFPAIDVAEHENEFVAIAEMPGVKKEDLKITFENDVLTLKGERKPYEIPQDARILQNEMRVREFRRSIQLPSDVDAKNISAELKDGVLRIVMPKAERARARQIEIR